MNYKILPILLLCFFSYTTTNSFVNFHTSSSKTMAYGFNTLESSIEEAYSNLKSNNFSLPNKESFVKGVEGFFRLKEKGQIQKDLLTLVDFSLSANQKRLWVIDLSTNSILYHTFVAHGRNTGVEYAEKFSNIPESFQSSLGFYATAETYFGKHGFSLRLDGLEKGINDNARKRAIVIHGADYATESFIENNGRLGRSLGCPSLPKEESEAIINAIKEKSCLFIFYPSETYKVQSQLFS